MIAKINFSLLGREVRWNFDNRFWGFGDCLFTGDNSTKLVGAEVQEQAIPFAINLELKVPGWEMLILQTTVPSKVLAGQLTTLARGVLACTWKSRKLVDDESLRSCRVFRFISCLRIR